MSTHVISQITDYSTSGDKRCIKFYDAEEYNDSTIRRPFLVGELVLFGSPLTDGGNVFDSRGRMIATLPYTSHPQIIREAANVVVTAYDA